MNADGQICTQRAIDKAEKEFATGLGYRRSSPLASLNYNFSFSDPPTWFLPSKVNSGHLDFIPEDGAIKVGRNQGDLFQAYTLMKVNNEADGDTKFKGGKVRPETFPMACLMAQGSRVSLAPTVLGYIYHGLGDIVSCLRGPGFTYISMPVHYIVGWLGKHFPFLYRSRPDSDFPKGYPQLATYAGIEPREVNISHARFIFRSDKSVIYRPTVFVEEKGCSLMDNEDLSDDYFEFLVCVRTAKLPVRIDEHSWIEPYFPNRFARQFGFDQGVPANKLAFGVSSRLNCSAEDMFEAQAVLLKRNTESLFYVPCSTHQGTCTYWYCKWWRTSCATYLGTSLVDIYAIFNKRPLNKKTVFSVSVLRDVTPGLRKEILLSDVGIEKSPSLHPAGSSRDVNLKRARYEKPDDLNGVDIGTVVAADAEILGCREEVNLVFDVLRAIINLSESGRIELEWFVKTVRHVFVCASQISDNARIIDQGNQIHDLFRRHDECLSTKKALESELTNSIQELKRIEAEELPVKEAEEVARVLRKQYDSGRLAVKRRVSDLQASIEQQKKLDVELCQSRIDANERLLPDVVRAEALNKSAEEGILNSIASLLHFCSKPE
ncbi:unnamed protein product [Malus baccata var. baccata]